MSGECFVKISGHLDNLRQQGIPFNELFNTLQVQVALSECLGQGWGCGLAGLDWADT